jgi:hypothetical protein
MQRHPVKFSVLEKHIASIFRLEEYAKQETGGEVNHQIKATYDV